MLQVLVVLLNVGGFVAMVAGVVTARVNLEGAEPHDLRLVKRGLRIAEVGAALMVLSVFLSAMVITE